MTDAERLKLFREARGFSISELAKHSRVSAKQISRLERGGSQRPRNTTITRLARALAVEPAVLVGEAPFPEDLLVPDTLVEEVGAVALAELIAKTNLPRAEFAKRAGLSESLIFSLLNADDATPVPSAVLDKLVDWIPAVREPSGADLGDSLRDFLRFKRSPHQRLRASMSMTHELRLKFDLLEHKYGASAQEIFELAPLLFVLLAEGSLDWRRRNVAKTKASLEQLDELAATCSSLNFNIPLHRFEEGVLAEESAAERADLFGNPVEKEFWEDMLNSTNSEEEINPFADYLRSLADGLDSPDTAHVHGSYARSAMGHYAVCIDTLRVLAGGSLGAELALRNGDARIADIPTELHANDKQIDRVAWLEGQMSVQTRQDAEVWGEVAATVALVSELSPDTPNRSKADE